VRASSLHGSGALRAPGDSRPRSGALPKAAPLGRAPCVNRLTVEEELKMKLTVDFCDGTDSAHSVTEFRHSGPPRKPSVEERKGPRDLPTGRLRETAALGCMSTRAGIPVSTGAQIIMTEYKDRVLQYDYSCQFRTCTRSHQCTLVSHRHIFLSLKPVFKKLMYLL